MIKRSANRQKRKVQETISPWGSNSSSLHGKESPKKRRKRLPAADLTYGLAQYNHNRESHLTLLPINQRQSASSLMRVRCNSVLNDRAMMQTLTVRKKAQPKQVLQQLPIMNFVIQGGDQQAEKSSRREKFKSSFMVKHRLSLIRKDMIEKEEDRKYKYVR